MFEAFLKYGKYSFVFLKLSTLISVRGLCTSVISLDYYGKVFPHLSSSDNNWEKGLQEEET